MVKRKNTAPSTASDQLRRFTNRENERKVFWEKVDTEQGKPLPVLMFHGVGGAGKTSLCKHLRESLKQSPVVPFAWLDFDKKAGGAPYVGDVASALALLRSQFDVQCPSFDIAYAMLRYKEGKTAEPAIKGKGAVGDSFDFLLELGQAVITPLPGVNVVTWIAKKTAPAIWGKVRDTALGQWLQSKAGNQDFLQLRGQQVQEIYPELNDRLLKDLSERLPSREGKICRGVIFLDTFEAVRENVNHDAEQHNREDWVRELYQPDSGILLVILGRDRLRWDEVDDDFKDRQYLETHRIGGLSYDDSLQFLATCDVTEPKLQQAILDVCREQMTASGKASPDAKASGYHAYSLALCVDTAANEQRQGRKTDPDSFRIGANDLAQRFLKSLPSKEIRVWVEKLSVTPRFDGDAALAALNGFSTTSMDRSDKTMEWQILVGQSFVSDIDGTWHTFHAIMRNSLREQLANNPDRLRVMHEEWHVYWSSRSRAATDKLAGLAWYHSYGLDPIIALEDWKLLAETARKERRMVDHFNLLGWWHGVESSKVLNPEQQAAQEFAKGSQSCEATIGNRTLNLTYAIGRFNAALRICNEEDFPETWARTQNNLGAAYCRHKTGDRAENLRRGIECYAAALRIYTEEDFPSDWARTQYNLGIAYGDLPTGDRAENLRCAIECYVAALRIYTEEDFPSDWADTQNGLGAAYFRLPTGDRAENLLRAIECYVAALRIYTEEDFPLDAAKTQSNLGVAYSHFPRGDRAENLRCAIGCYVAALHICTEEDFPEAWAMIQENLGVAYCDLPTDDRAENLRRGIECYAAALRIYTEEDFPSDWARTQNNLGNAHCALRSGDRGENLRRAIACFNAAGRAKHDRPLLCAIAQWNLGLAYRELAAGGRTENLAKAKRAFEAALQIYMSEGLHEETNQLQGCLESLSVDHPQLG
jgi:tetratricopeptide (TPR) repeat protein